MNAPMPRRLNANPPARVSRDPDSGSPFPSATRDHVRDACQELQRAAQQEGVTAEHIGRFVREIEQT
jgi:hypothetical protein